MAKESGGETIHVGPGRIQSRPEPHFDPNDETTDRRRLMNRRAVDKDRSLFDDETKSKTEMFDEIAGLFRELRSMAQTTNTVLRSELDRQIKKATGAKVE